MQLSRVESQIVSKYLRDIDDVKNFTLTNKKNLLAIRSLHFNTVDVNSQRDIEVFPSMQTLNLYGDDRLKREDVTRVETMIRGNTNIFAVRSYKFIGINEESNQYADDKWKIAKGAITMDDIREYTPDINGVLDLRRCKVQRIDISELPASNRDKITTVRSIKLPLSLPAFEGWLMSYFPNVHSLVLPWSVTRIGESAFFVCQLTHIGLPVNLKVIENEAFNSCRLESLKIPSSVTRIGDEAFQSMPLTSISIPEATIGNGLFDLCNELRFVTLPSTVTSIPPRTFRWCDNLISLSCSAQLREIGREAFKDCMSLRVLRLPDSIERIGSEAFENCFALDMKLPTSLTSLSKAFAHCIHLEEANIPEGVSDIPDYCFAYAGISSVTIPSTVTHIGCAFYNCGILEELNIPNVDTLSYNVIDKCGMLTALTVPELVADYGRIIRVRTRPGLEPVDILAPLSLYYINGHLRNVTVADELTAPQDEVLYHSALFGLHVRHLHIKDTVQLMSSGSVIEIKELESIDIPTAALKYDAVTGCSNLTAATIMQDKDKWIEYDEVFSNCPKLSHVTVRMRPKVTYE